MIAEFIMSDPMPLPKWLKAQGWKIKIYDRERLEPPHVTLMHRADVWRISLRDRDFLPPEGGKWRDINGEVKEFLEENWSELCSYWDSRHPDNPVSSRQEDNDGDDT